MKKSTILRLISGLLIISAISSVSLAQKVYTPTRNSKERKEILNALKSKIDEDGEKKAIIHPAYFRIKGNWAYLQDIRKENSTVEQFTYNVKALLKNIDGKWSVVKYLVGSDDSAYINWWKEFKTPKAIFPL